MLQIKIIKLRKQVFRNIISLQQLGIGTGYLLQAGNPAHNGRAALPGFPRLSRLGWAIVQPFGFY